MTSRLACQLDCWWLGWAGLVPGSAAAVLAVFAAVGTGGDAFAAVHRPDMPSSPDMFAHVASRVAGAMAWGIIRKGNQAERTAVERAHCHATMDLQQHSGVLQGGGVRAASSYASAVRLGMCSRAVSHAASYTRSRVCPRSSQAMRWRLCT